MPSRCPRSVLTETSVLLLVGCAARCPGFCPVSALCLQALQGSGQPELSLAAAPRSRVPVCWVSGFCCRFVTLLSVGQQVPDGPCLVAQQQKCGVGMPGSLPGEFGGCTCPPSSLQNPRARGAGKVAKQLWSGRPALWALGCGAL